jgi:hypothetical protein
MPFHDHTHHRHAGIDPRNRFLPPQYHVVRGTDAAEAPAVALLSDTFGEEIPSVRATLRLAYSESAFHIAAEVIDEAPTIFPDVDPLHHRFWQQDHVEFRLQPRADRDLVHLQVILAASGKVLVGPPEGDAFGMECPAERTDRGWRLTAELPYDRLGVAAPHPGQTMRGLLANMRWGDGFGDILAMSPVQLGFPHAERFAEFVFEEAPSITLESVDPDVGILPVGTSRVGLRIANREPEAVDGALLITRDGDGVRPAQTHRLACTLHPGENMLQADLALERPLFTRFRFSFRPQNGMACPLGAITLRGGVPRHHGIDPGRLTHPYLFFDAAELEEIREKVTHPGFEDIREALQPAEKDFRLDDLPATPGEASFDFTPKCGNWFRVARESLLRNGEGNRKASSRRIWAFLGEEGQGAARKVVESVNEDKDALTTLLSAFNAILRRDDLWDPAAFGEVTLPAETREIFETRPNDLTERERMKHNRVLIQSSIECIAEFHVGTASRAGSLLSKWVASGDQRLIETATRLLDFADAMLITSPIMGLSTGGTARSLGMAYDAFSPHLTDEQRAVWHRVCLRFLRLYLHTARTRHWDSVCVPNANPVCNGGGGVLALALLAEFPEEAGEALYYARKHIWNFLDYCTGVHGGNAEGMQYWQYGTSNLLGFADALERVTGHDDGLLAHPGIEQTMNMVRAGLSNDGSTHGFNDTIPLPVGQKIAWFCAGRYGDPFALWYGDHARRVYTARIAAGKQAPYRESGLNGLLYRPDVPESFDAPVLPTAYVLPDIEYGILRSGSNYDCTWVAGLKGSRPPYTHHNQPDTGSYYIHVRGERLLIDPGYYKGGPDQHSIPFIGGVQPHQPAGYVGKLATAEAGDLRWQACDSTAAYKGAATRAVRHLVMVGEEGVVLLDDIVPADPAAEIFVQYQCGGETRDIGAGRTVHVQGDAAALQIDLLGRDALGLELQPERDLKSTHWGYKFADCRHFPVTGTYAAEEGDPLITVFTEASGAAAKPAVTREGDRLTVGLPGGGSAGFVLLPTGWRPLAFA